MIQQIFGSPKFWELCGNQQTSEAFYVITTRDLEFETLLCGRADIKGHWVCLVRTRRHWTLICDFNTGFGASSVVYRFEPPHDKTNKMACAPSKDSDPPGHPPSLIRVFAVRMKKAWVLSYSLSAQRRLWSDLADAQVDLSFAGRTLILLVLSCRGSSAEYRYAEGINSPMLENVKRFLLLQLLFRVLISTPQQLLLVKQRPGSRWCTMCNKNWSELQLPSYTEHVWVFFLYHTQNYANKTKKQRQHVPNLKYDSSIWATSRENLSSGFPTREDSNRPAQLQRLARVLKFRL